MNTRVLDSPAATAPLLHAQQLGKKFAERWILRNADLSIAAGESVALLGESGAGKSTVLNMIAGLESFDEGSIALAGRSFHSQHFDADATAQLRREQIGFVFQAFHLLPHLDVWQNVALPLLLNGMSPAMARERAVDLLERIGMADQVDARPSTLSGGEQQRASLARALVHRPALLLADEPTGNLDPQTASLALDLMHRVIAETGCAMLMVTHSEQAARICTRRVRLIDAQLLTLSDAQSRFRDG